MPVNMHAESVLRKFETDVLDKHYQSFSLNQRDRGTAIYATLAQFDCWAIRSLISPGSLGITGEVQQIKNLEEALTQALRWLHDGTEQIDISPTNDSQVVEEAGSFCDFAGIYSHIADLHKMYGRRQVSIEVNETERKVRFVTPSNQFPAASIVGIFEQSYRFGKMPLAIDATEKEELRNEVMSALSKAEFHYCTGRIVLGDLRLVNNDKIKELIDWGMPQEPLPLDPEADLAGFTVGELRLFYEALRRWSFCCTSGFLISLKKGKQQWECAPTQCLRRSEFIDSLYQLTGLQKSKLELIAQRLTYDSRTTLPDVYQQPLFCGAHTVSWSASVVQDSRYLRNMLKLMSRTVELQNTAATLIGSRERPMLRELGELLSQKGGTQFKLMVSMTAGEETGEIDLLAYNNKYPEELLIVEGKSGLGVDEINEVNTATNEMRSGQKQLTKVKNILVKLSDDKKTNLFPFVNWQAVKHIYAVVVSAEAEPNDKYDHTEIPGISLQTIRSRLRKNHYASPAKFWRACLDRKWMDPLRAYEEHYKAFHVDTVTYELPILRESEEAAQVRFRKERELQIRQFNETPSRRKKFKKSSRRKYR